MKSLQHSLFAALAALLLAGPAAAQKVTVEQNSPLYSEPRMESSQVAQLQQGATGEVIGKQGVWLNLKTGAGTGWLFSFSVRFESQGAESSSGGSSLGRVFAPRRSSPTVTSTIGIRGIEEEDLKGATFDAEQMKLLDSYAASKEAAEKGARGVGLSHTNVDYLDGRK
jgi:hypothetical protein